MKIDASDPNDAELIRQVLDGNVNAFEPLLNRYQDLVLKIVKRHVPPREMEEMVQDVFIRAYHSLPTIKVGSLFSNWLATIAVRTCYDYWRKAYRTKEIPLSSLTDNHERWLDGVLAEESKDALYKKGSDTEAMEILDGVLAQLTAKERMVVELVYLEGLTSREAGEILGWSVANVKVRSFRIRKKLEKIIRHMAGT